MIKMDKLTLKKLSLCIENDFEEDIVVIFAEPAVKDVEKLINDKFLLDEVVDLLCANNIHGKEGNKDHNGYYNPSRTNIQGSVNPSRRGEELWRRMWGKEIMERNSDENLNFKSEDQYIIMDEGECLEGSSENKIHAKEDIDDHQHHIKETTEYSDNGYNTTKEQEDKLGYLPKVDEECFVKEEAIFVEDGELFVKREDGEEGDGEMLVKLEDEGNQVVNVNVEEMKTEIIMRQQVKENKNNKKISKGIKLKCDLCEKSFSVKASLEIHKRLHTGEKPYSCDVCNKSFSSKKVLKDHKKIHTGDKQYSCELCNKSFYAKSALNNHKLYHSGEKLNSCDICGKAFVLKSCLTSHKKIHNKLFTCDLCGISCPTGSALKSHSRVHTNEKPYSCDICGKSFSQKPHLNRHKRSHTGEKPYSCDVCGKLFSEKDYLNVHKKKHARAEPYSCECGKTFLYKKTLEIHKIEVHKENTLNNDIFICDVCKKIFSCNGRLNRHKLTHSGEKPYSCDVCGRAFAEKGNLKAHQKIHSETKKEPT